ncbi:MAG: 5'-nucleotidase C-terminal domain-containing protein, partial [Lachnospiraceae bacterium]
MKKTIKKRIISLLLVLTMVVSGFIMPVSEAKAAESATITIVHTNDTHGRVNASDTEWGFAKIAAKVQQIKRDNSNTLLLDAGDTLHGMPVVNLNQGENAVRILNETGYDAMALGNHDFNYGAKRVQELSAQAKFSMLAANVYNQDGTNAFTPYIIKEKAGVRIAIFGLSTPETVFRSHPDNTKGLRFEDPCKTAKKMVEELKGKADIIIALTHLGVEGDYTSTKLAKQVDGIDVIIDGHSHVQMKQGYIPNYVNGTLIAQTGKYGNMLGVIQLKVSNGTVTEKSASLLPVDQTVQEEPQVKSLIEKLQEANKKILATVIGKTDVLLDGEREHVRVQETNLGNLAADAMRVITGSDIALENGGGIRASIQPGDITKNHMATVFPFGNTVMVKEVTGEAVKKALEQSVSGYPEAMGGFFQVSGIKVQFDPMQEAGSRIVSIAVNGKLLNPKKIYKVALNDFNAAGGDGYTMFTDCKLICNYGTLDEIF